MSDIAATVAVEITQEEAERLSSRIGLRLEAMADSWTGALPLIREAIEREAFRPLGYASHGAYVSDRFGDALSKLGVDMRREVVKELTEAGLSIRAIAPIVGISKSQVAVDAAEVSRTGHLAEVTERQVQYDDGEWSRAVEGVPGLNPITGEVVEAGDEDGNGEAAVIVEETTTTTTRTVTGLDGKTYTRQPSSSRRSSILDDARTAGWQLRKAVERIERIVQDDRFGKNKAEIRTALQPHLDFANEVFADL